MIRNDLKVGFRNLRKNRVNAVVNLGGLAIGMAVAILIGLWMLTSGFSTGTMSITTALPGSCSINV